jgi:hypothetical protein
MEDSWMKKWIVGVLVTGVMGFVLSGCSVSRAEDVMRVPDLKIDLSTTWTERLKAQNLVSDILKISEDEFVAVTSDQQLSIQLFKESDQMTSSFSVNGNNLISMDTYDVNDDGIKEVFIAYFHDSGRTIVEVYDMTGESKLLYTADGKDFAITDLKNGTAFYVISEEEQNEMNESYLYELDIKTFEQVDKVNLGYLYGTKMLSGKLSSGQSAVFYSAGVGAHSAVSDAVFKNESGKLETLFYKEEGETNQPYTAYYAQVKDVNMDGVIEFPFMDPSPFQTDSSMAGTIWLTRYTNWTNNQFEDVAVFHETYYASLKMEPDWVENYQITRSSYEEALIWYRYTDTSTSADLMTIYYLDDIELQTFKRENAEFEVLDQSEELSAVVIWSETILEVQKDAIKGAFVINPKAVKR